MIPHRVKLLLSRKLFVAQLYRQVGMMLTSKLPKLLTQKNIKRQSLPFQMPCVVEEHKLMHLCASLFRSYGRRDS